MKNFGLACWTRGRGPLLRSLYRPATHEKLRRPHGISEQIQIDLPFGTAVITPRWLFILAAARPPSRGDPILVDEWLETLDPSRIQTDDVVGFSVNTGNALRGYEVGRLAHERSAKVVYGGIHATLFPKEPFERSWADVVVKGDGDVAG